MKKRIISAILALVLVISTPVFAYANSTTVTITDASSYKSTNLSGNSITFMANVGTVIYQIQENALTAFYKDSDVKYYSFTYGDFTVKADKNGFYDFSLERIEFKLGIRSFNATFVYKNGTTKGITETMTENIYTIKGNDVTEISTAVLNGEVINCTDNKNGVLTFITKYIGEFKVADFKFNDVQEGKWYYSYVNKSGAYGILSGVGDGNFEPQTNITRAQLAAMIVKATSELISFRIDDKNTFKDVPQGKWYYDYIMQCATLGLMDGTGDNKFEPEKNATRQEISAVITRVLKVMGTHAGEALPVIDPNTCESELSSIYKDASDIQKWAREYVLFCNKIQIMIGDSEGFRPKSNITRAECAKIFWLIFSENV